MNYVADTHIIIWMITARHTRLGRDAARVLGRVEKGQDHLHASVVSLLEISDLEDRGRIRLPNGWRDFRQQIMRVPSLTLESVTVEDIDQARTLTPLADPFDRMIAATALRLDVPLLTADQRIRESRLVETIW